MSAANTGAAVAVAPEPRWGLTQREAEARLVRHGPNTLTREQPRSAWLFLGRQFRSGMVWLLLGACGVAALLGEGADAVAIATIVVLNALVGFLQEYRADRAVLALRALTAPSARVLRDGVSAVIPASQVVPGDALVLEAGDVVAADARLLSAHALLTLEAALTGESTPVDKQVGALPDSTPLAERKDRVFMGTSVAAGTAVAEVTATGMDTELGRIAHLVRTAQEPQTPLQQRLEGVTRMLLVLCVAVGALVAGLGLARGQAGVELLLAAVALAVAAVPEGLPTVVTLALAVGVQRMVKGHVLVRRMQAVEALGAATVICTDKTGTLTQGIMEVRELWPPESAQRVLEVAAACCDAELGQGQGPGAGDPTELALLAAARARGVERSDVERERPRVSEQPFDSDRRRMSVLRSDGVLSVKGALEALLPLCRQVPPGVAEALASLAGRALRVLAVAEGRGPDERDLTLVGLVGLADPPRPEAVEAVRAAREAGVRTVMITGDHPATALAIAKELGLLREGESPEGIVHARATAEQKLHIVRGWKARGEVVAMTGDGVNDAPALREAHIGIAMGRTGAEVTREASDLILTDDNFASIVAAVREGRGIYENIRKTLVYLLAGNAGELVLMLGASLLGLPLPLLPLHLLWVNLVTDGLPALALVMDPAPPDVMRRPPRRPEEPMLGRREWTAVLATGLLDAAVSLGTFLWSLQHLPVEEARTLTFTVLVCCQVLRSFAARSVGLLHWEVGAFDNRPLLAVAALTLALQVALPEVPALAAFFSLVPLDATHLALALGLGFIPVSVLELRKLLLRGMARARARAPLGG
ncbi:cation-translocating P-type ATPase [Corallococcus sp. AB045]|uniref:cation-translocating P-type ATPase n=1 Tax=Corallococcus sp. AB045 TaxID=2316719 RepID=UPI000EC301EC|nr:cation-translocating P-type ATPase [Corallococcus sp. AB045]RKH76467.1 cation-translocating P-type ATPase [Corallococcus sp. AB045]